MFKCKLFGIQMSAKRLSASISDCRNRAVHMYNPSTLKASLDTSDCLARRADASPYFAMREGNVGMCAKLC